MISRRSFLKASSILLINNQLQSLVPAASNTSEPVADCDEVAALIRRVLPSHEKQFVCELIPAENGRNVFEYESRFDRKIILRGNNGVSLAVGFNQFLRRELHLSYDWQAKSTLKLSGRLPVSGKVRQACLARERFFLNYCTYGYTMPFWQWDQWQRFIDWMVMNGINRPLLQCGQEAVWLRVWQSYGMSADHVRAYFSGPAHLPWHRMANLDRWSGPLPISYIEGQQKLQQQILARARALGMKPILSGFAGHVPAELRRLRPQANIVQIKPGWGGMDAQFATSYLDPTDPLFAEIQKRFLDEQTKLYGTDHLYAADPFNEIDPPSWEPAYLAKIAKAIVDSLTEADSQARWYLMAWMFHYDKRWTEERQIGLFSLVPLEKLILLDYACEEDEVYRRTQAFHGRPFIWNYLGNYGGNTNLQAPLDSTAEHVRDVLRVPNCVGIGSTLEGLNVNSVIYEMMFEQCWQSDATIQVDKWIENYATRRAGRFEPAVIEAWQTLASRLLTEKGTAKRCNGNIFQAYPSFEKLKGWTDPNFLYRQEDLVRALRSMLKATVRCESSDAYCFDVVNLTRQALSNLGLEIYKRMKVAYGEKALGRFRLESEKFLQLGQDLDVLLGTRHPFLLGSWLTDARSWGKTSAEADYYERNAREIITCWHKPGGGLTDYASRQWNVLMRGYYLPRWTKFIELVIESLEQDGTFPEQSFTSWTRNAAVAWIENGTEVYSSGPQGDPVKTARQLFEKYVGR